LDATIERGHCPASARRRNGRRADVSGENATMPADPKEEA